ncbi:MAG TPA: alpha/beta hydrolase [Mycobacteriales bacterium]|nr:alpha/beta hydrolase [Mycobacteriales bacterium]
MKRKTLAAGGLAAVAAVLMSATAATADNPDPLTKYEHQAVHWKKCRLGPDDELGKRLDAGGVQCANLTVPLNYSDPGGRSITLAVSRYAAIDRKHRIGTLFLNSGGPGGIALDMPLDWHKLMKGAGDRYDLIGMDPRFIGRSTPLDCHWPISTMLTGAGTTRGGFEKSVALESRLAADCEVRHADVLPYVTTRNTARDMDVVRAALGEKRISYLGYSYGTYLGEVYTQLFPGRTDRVVLDSALDPRRYGVGMLHDMIPANQATFENWAAWTARRDAHYHLGRTQARVIGRVDRILQAAAHKPLQVGDFRVGADVVPNVLMDSLSDDRDGPRSALASDMHTLDRIAAGKPTTPNAGLLDTLAYFASGSESATGSAQAAIICGDRAAHRNPQWYWRSIQHDRPASPLFAPLLDNITACAFWPKPVEAPTHVGNATPALIVNSTGDPRTPYFGARRLHRLLTGSRLVTLRGAAIHAVYANYGDSCVDGTVAAYLESGTLPAHDRTCGA